MSAISKWKSNLFEVTEVDELDHIPNTLSDDWQSLSDSLVLEAISHDNQSDLTVAITEYALQDNFYMRRVDGWVSVISLFEVGDLLQYNNVPLENFIIVNLYKLVALSKIYNNCPPTDEGIPDIIHDETRSCLFDMNGLKTDVIHSTARPCICSQCQATMLKTQLPQGFLSKICKELKNVRKPMFYRLQDYIKKRPLCSIAIMVASALIIELLANAAYDIIAQIWK